MYIDDLRRNIVECCEHHNIEGVTKSFLAKKKYGYRTLLRAWRALQYGYERSFAQILNLQYPLPKKKPVPQTGETMDLAF